MLQGPFLRISAKNKMSDRHETQVPERDLLTGGKNFVPYFIDLLCVSSNSKHFLKNVKKEIIARKKNLLFEKRFFQTFFRKMLRIA